MDMMSTMTGGSQDEAAGGYVVAVPYPGRGHVNPMMSFCSELASRGISVILVMTEEWLELIGGEPPEGCGVATIPNCIPSEKDRNRDMMGFFAAVGTNMKPALDSVIDGLDVTVSCIVADANIKFITGFGGRPNTPFVTLWVSAPSLFFAYYHFDLIMAANSHGEENDGKVRIGSIPFEFPVKSVEIPFANLKSCEVNKALQWIVQTATSTNGLLLTSNEELEPEIINALRASLSIRLYTIGPCIPYSSLKLKPDGEQEVPSYIHWLDTCPKDSVLYVSLGSFVKLPDEELEEISKGLKASKVRYIWSVKVDDDSNLARNLKDDCEERGLIVPWCDQLRVLCHPSVGGFLVHCGWNSVMEAIFAGVPMLTFPLVLEQVHVCNLILNKWGIGLKLKDKNKETVSREEITTSITRLMDLTENTKIYEVRKRIKGYQNICQKAFQSSGSTDL